MAALRALTRSTSSLAEAARAVGGTCGAATRVVLRTAHAVIMRSPRRSSPAPTCRVNGRKPVRKLDISNLTVAHRRVKRSPHRQSVHYDASCGYPVPKAGQAAKMQDSACGWRSRRRRKPLKHIAIRFLPSLPELVPSKPDSKATEFPRRWPRPRVASPLGLVFRGPGHRAVGKFQAANDVGEVHPLAGAVVANALGDQDRG
jgi:hypothetical protein